MNNSFTGEVDTRTVRVADEGELLHIYVFFPYYFVILKLCIKIILYKQ